MVIETKNGIDVFKFPYDRKSWLWWWKWIRVPAVINRRALNRACVIKWKNAILGIFIARLYIIVPNWLNVDRAIIFFMSHSVRALSPAIQAVRAAENRRRNSKGTEFLIKLKKRIKIKIPAVTRVEEWTRAETGVGAAIAAGSQLIKGNWALFVIAAVISINPRRVSKGELHGSIGSHWVFSLQAIVNKINTSPNRLVIAVIIAAPTDFGVW